jgi:NADH-quinone oxidoreductase subunit G
VQSFNACVKPAGDARPGWKVLRVLGTMLGLPEFGYDTIEQVRSACLRGRDIPALLSNKTTASATPQPAAVQGLQRIADVPIYFTDALARRSMPLQKTRDAQEPRAWMNAKQLQQLRATAGQPVLVKQGAGEARLVAALDDKLPDGCVRIASGHALTAGLGAMSGSVSVEALSAEKAA